MNAADFDADTPKPQRRPVGVPLPGYVTLPPGESLTATFAAWDRAGRTPEGSVLLTKCSGVLVSQRYSVVANPHRDGRPHASLGPVGSVVPVESLDGWTTRVVVVEAKKPGVYFEVMAPPAEVARAAG